MVPLEIAGHAEIIRGTGSGIVAHIEGGGTTLDYAGGGTVTFETPGSILFWPFSPLSSRAIDGMGTCDTASASLNFDFSDASSGSAIGTIATMDRMIHAAVNTSHVYYSGSTSSCCGGLDSGHRGEIRILLPANTITVAFTGIRGFIDVDTVSIDGDALLLTPRSCATTCFDFRGQPLTSAPAEAFGSLIQSVMYWTIGPEHEAVVTPTQVGVVAPTG